MRPIDTIRRGLDSDLSKYHGTTLCRITSDDHIKDIVGIGLCALVNPLNRFNANDKETLGDEDMLQVVIVNRTKGFVEGNISGKYYVLVINGVTDKPLSSIGLLVPKTFIDEMEIFKNLKDLRDTSGQPIEAYSKENTATSKE